MDTRPNSLACKSVSPCKRSMIVSSIPMVGSFPFGVCESSQCKGEGLTAHSVQYPGQSLGLLHTRLIVLDAEPQDRRIPIGPTDI